MDLDMNERHIFVRMLAERIEADNQAFETLSERLQRGS
jgi:hypothetical protein